jgi:hypothetical protein
VKSGCAISLSGVTCSIIIRFDIDAFLKLFVGRYRPGSTAVYEYCSDRYIAEDTALKRYKDVSNPIVLQHVYCSQNNRPHGTIKHIHSSHLSFCSRLAICDHSRKLRSWSQLCDYCGRTFQSQLAALVASRPSQIVIYIYQTILV